MCGVVLTLGERLHRESGSSEEGHVLESAPFGTVLQVQLLQLCQRHKALQHPHVLHIHLGEPRCEHTLYMTTREHTHTHTKEQ